MGGKQVERKVRHGVHLQYISQGMITWILNRPTDLRFLQFLHTSFIQLLLFSFFFFWSTTKHFTWQNTLMQTLKIRLFDSCLVVFVVKNRLLNSFCRNFQTKKTATLCSRRPTVSISPILSNMFVYPSLVLPPFVNLDNIGRAFCLNVTQFKYPCSSSQHTDGGLIRVSQSFVTALTSLVITSTLITVRSPFPLIWIIRIILVKGLWRRLFCKSFHSHAAPRESLMEISLKCGSGKWESNLSTDVVHDIAGCS